MGLKRLRHGRLPPIEGEASCPNEKDIDSFPAQASGIANFVPLKKAPLEDDKEKAS
jgi:hypothetical protein